MSSRKIKIQKILYMSKEIDQKEVSNEEGLLDYKKLEENSIHKKQIKKLKEMKVSSDELRENGFILAAMVLGRYLK